MKLVNFVVIIFLAIITAVLTIIGGKTNIGIIIVLFMVLSFIVISLRVGTKKANKYLLYCIVTTIPFPYIVQFNGRDALSVTTVLIFLAFIIIVFNRLLISNWPIKIELENILPILLLFGLTLSLLLNRSVFFEQSLRSYVANCSGILLFFVILESIKEKSDVMLIIKIFLFTIFLQAVISVTQVEFPGISNYLDIFARRDGSVAASLKGGYLRARGTVWDYELLAEWFLVGAILSIALIYETGKFLFSITMFSCIAGIVFTKTRSDMFLLLFVFILLFILIKIFKKDYNLISAKIIISLILGIGIFSLLFRGQVAEMFQRLALYAQSEDLTSADSINRGKAWGLALDFVKHPRIFGNGLYRVASLDSYDGPKGGFHSLYFTLLYQIGIFGLISHIIFWYVLLKKALNVLVKMPKNDNWYIIFFLTITLLITLIDQVKIDYLRYGHTIQFAWVIYALLVVSLRQRCEINENTVVSKVAI